MYPDHFKMIHNLIKPDIKRRQTSRKPISTEERFPLTLRYLAIGESKMSL